MSLNIAMEYEREFYIVDGNCVYHEETLQYGEFLDLCSRYGEWNLYDESEGIPEKIVMAFQLGSLRPYLQAFGLDLSCNLESEVIALRYPDSVEVCPDVWTDAQQFDLDSEGGAEAAVAISNWLFAEKERCHRKEIPFGKVIFPTLHRLSSR